MHEILFRGRRTDNAKWVEGYFVKFTGRFTGDQETYIQTVKNDGRLDLIHEVYPATVGQYTGLQDKNGVRIFEGDILAAKVRQKRRIHPADNIFGERIEYLPEKKQTVWSVEWKNFNASQGFMVYGIDRRFNNLLSNSTIKNCECCVIGNIHDNPELMKGGPHVTRGTGSDPACSRNC